MPCFHPLKAYRSREKNPETGRYLVTFNPLKSLVEGSSFSVPCGRCIGCRIDHSLDWAMRCMHEASLHPDNSFITLTYDDQHLPTDYSVHVRDLQLFNKRLRKSLGGKKIRYFAVGEYGEQTLRPHYHALIFNHSFPDRKLHAVRDGNRYYKSDALDALWPSGQLNEVTDLTYESAAYCARYSLKKINGKDADDHYYRTSPVDGRTYRVNSEFVVMSRRPGIGSGWYQKFGADCFPSDFLIYEGRKHKPPKFYFKQLTEDQQKPLKRARKRQSLKQRHNNTRERLAVREEVLQSKISKLKRTL